MSGLDKGSSAAANTHSQLLPQGEVVFYGSRAAFEQDGCVISPTMDYKASTQVR